MFSAAATLINAHNLKKSIHQAKSSQEHKLPLVPMCPPMEEDIQANDSRWRGYPGSNAGQGAAMKHT
jgi:hypothetical protein